MMINDLKKYFNTYKCSGIKINDLSGYIINLPSVKLRFCEAVNTSFNVPLLMNKQNLGCRGAERNLGFRKDDDEDLGSHIFENTGISIELIREMLADTSVIKDQIKNLALGITEEMEKTYKPDFFIVYTTALRSMQFIHHLAITLGVRPFIAPYSLLSICGNVFARGYNTGNVCISFGCPESRKYGGVDRDEVIIGIPGEMAKQLIEKS